MNRSVLGWVYVLTNPSFRDGIIKIGFTNKPTPQERAQELSKHTGVPTEFIVVYAVKVPNAHSVETQVHRILQDKRARDNREFFDCTVAQAVQTIQSVAGRSVVAKIDNRKAIKQNRLPEQTPARSPAASNKKSTQATKRKTKRHGWKWLMMMVIIFLLAMMAVGKWAEHHKPNHSATLPRETQTNTASAQQHAWQISHQDVQLAWDKIPDNIQKDLAKEQRDWAQQKSQQCQQASNPIACEIQYNQARVKYLQGFSIR